MGRKGSRYTIEEKLFLVNQGAAPNAVQRLYGLKDDQIRQWIKRYKFEGINGLRHRSMGKYPSDLQLADCKK